MLRFLLVFVFASATLAAEGTWDKNYADNPSIEEDGNRDGEPDGWQGSAHQSPAKLAWDKAVAHSGKASLRISDSLGSGGRTWQENSGRWSTATRRPVIAGEKYTLGLWIRTQGVTGQAHACMSFSSDGKWLAEASTPRISGTNDWKFVTVTATAPAGATTAVVFCALSSSKGTAWFDDISMVRGTGVSPDKVAEAAPPLKYEFNDTANWYPFNFPQDDTNLDSINLTHLLDAPAGKHGFLTVRGDGHFYFQDGTRIRFFGTNLVGASAFPPKEQAPILASRLAKYGVNLLRIHAIDGGWGLGLIDYARGDSRQINAEALDRLDFLVAELKKRGIYLYFDLLDYRRFKSADGVADADQFQHGWQNSIKGATIFNDRLIELQKELAERFLTHRNPYTGLRYVDDPALAVVEITNENSVFYFSNTSLTLPAYFDELKARWNRWLLEQYKDRAGLARAWTNDKGECALVADEDPARGTVLLPARYLYQDRNQSFVGERSPVRVSAMLRFFFDLERRYYAQMRGKLKEIGVKVPITGTNQTFCPASVYADSVNDFVARNNYWLHPNVNAKPFFTFRNQSILRSELMKTSNPMVEVASSTVLGKPMIVPEFNCAWPNEYRAECLPLMSAYGCLQDWDGLLFFSYRPEGKTLEKFGNQSDPVRWGAFPATALMFHRQDVSVAKNTVVLNYNGQAVFAGGPSHGRAPSSPFRRSTYVSKVRSSFGAGEMAVPQHANGPDRGLTSDTGELLIDTGRGLFTIHSPRTKAAIGYLDKLGTIDLGGVAVECRTPYAAILITSLDNQPTDQSRRLLITAIARAENTGQAFDQNKSRVPAQGRLPVIAEPVDAQIAIKLPGSARVYPLDPSGRRLKPLPAERHGDLLYVRTMDARSPWCEVVVD